MESLVYTSGSYHSLDWLGLHFVGSLWYIPDVILLPYSLYFKHIFSKKERASISRRLLIFLEARGYNPVVGQTI